MQSGGSGGILKYIKNKLQNKQQTYVPSGDICLSNTSYLKQIRLNINNKQHCITLIGESHAYTIEEDTINQRIQVWSLLALLRILYKDNVSIYLEFPFLAVLCLLNFGFSYYWTQSNELLKLINDLIADVKQKYEDIVKKYLICDKKKSYIVENNGDKFRFILKNNEILIVPKIYRSENIGYTFFKIFSLSKDLSNIYFIDYRNVCKYYYIIESKTEYIHYYNFQKFDTKSPSIEEIIAWKWKMESDGPTGLSIGHEMDVSQFIGYTHYLTAFFYNNLTELEQLNYFDFEDDDILSCPAHEMIEKFTLKYCYEGEMTKMLNIYLEHADRNGNDFFKSMFSYLLTISQFVIYIIKNFINEFNKMRRQNISNYTSLLFKTNIAKMRIQISEKQFINPERDDPIIDRLLYQNIVDTFRFNKYVCYYDIINDADSLIMDFYTICQIYDNIMNEKKNINYHCVVTGMDHSKFIARSFQYVYNAVGQDFPVIGFNKCENIESNKSMYHNLANFLYPMGQSDDFRQI